MKFTPTAEQNLTALSSRRGGSMVVRAFAGAGKTSTLGLISENHPALRVLYLAYNKSIATEAGSKMPAKVRSMTFHALAYRAMQPDKDRLSQRLNGYYIVQHFNYHYNDYQAASFALSILDNYCVSADRELSEDHIPLHDFEVNPAPDPQRRAIALSKARAIKRRAFEIAKEVWKEQSNPLSKFPITHDTYVKLWSFQDPVINTDLILFDEGQDAAPIFIDIVQKQTHCDVIWVGDEHQQIYAWRGAINALSRVKAEHHHSLTESFRFHQGIADLANIILGKLGETKPLKGVGTDTTDARHAILARTNTKAISEYMEARKRHPDKTVALVGARSFMSLINDAESLQAGKPKGQFALFENWSQLVEYTETAQGQDLRVLVKLINEYGIQRLRKEIEGSDEEFGAQISVSTIHKAKGLEWGSVKVCDDWPVDDDEEPLQLSDEELRLAYVAMTRAKHSLDFEGLRPWIPELPAIGRIEGFSTDEGRPEIKVALPALEPEECPIEALKDALGIEDEGDLLHYLAKRYMEENAEPVSPQRRLAF